MLIEQALMNLEAALKVINSMSNKFTQQDWDRLILIVKEEYPVISSSFTEETEDEWAYWEIICRHHDKWDMRIRLEDDEVTEKDREIGITIKAEAGVAKPLYVFSLLNPPTEEEWADKFSDY